MKMAKRFAPPRIQPAAKPTNFGGPEGGGPYQSPNPIDSENQWAFGGPNPSSFTPNRPRTVGVAGVNPRSTEPSGKGPSNKRY